MSHYLVVSDEISSTIPILDDGSGPTEYWREVICVEAPNRRQARIEGVRKLRYMGIIDDPGDNPFRGIKVEDAACPHGVLMCDDHGSECEKCLAEIEGEDKRW